jgi:uncharacterized protein YijF (DUF1287 family)
VRSQLLAWSLASVGLGCHARSEAPRSEAAHAPELSSPGAGERGSEVAPEPAPAAHAEPEASLGVRDRGIFGDLDARVQIELPADLEPADALAVVDEPHELLVLYVGGWPAKVYPLHAREGVALELPGGSVVRLRPGDHAELAPLLRRPEQVRALAPGVTAPPGDRDDDGIPDPLDIEIGAIKTTLNGANYDQSYVSIPYPGGDVPREIGACTDVIVRALRNAGIDLQVELHEDIARAPRRYPMVEQANADIDHRRVRTLLPWFRAHWLALADDAAPRPGDVVFMDTIPGRKGPDHIGVLGGGRGDNGELLVANNWTEGYETSFMELLGYVEVTQRFRAAPGPEHRGPIAATTRQLVVVVAPGWDEFRGHARRFERDTVGGSWRPVGEPFAVVLGRDGLAWGRGLHGEGAPEGQRGPIKREGDGCSPAGVFAIGGAYGRAAKAGSEAGPELELTYASESPTLRCVDDPGSRHYNRIVDAAEVDEDWGSAEPMRRYYELAIVVEHNRARAPGAGSCIFLHAWHDADTPVSGCTAMATADLDELAAWLEPGAVIVTLPRARLAKHAEPWGLPELASLAPPP